MKKLILVSLVAVSFGVNAKSAIDLYNCGDDTIVHVHNTSLDYISGTQEVGRTINSTVFSINGEFSAYGITVVGNDNYFYSISGDKVRFYLNKSISLTVEKTNRFEFCTIITN